MRWTSPTLAITVLALAAILSGCATRPVSNSEAKPTPPDRILDSSLLQPSRDSGKVTVKRDSGFLGSACSSRIFVDAKPVADIKPAEKIVLYLPPGEHIFSAWPNGICGGGMSEVKGTVKPGGELSFRVGMGSDGGFEIYSTAF